MGPVVTSPVLTGSGAVLRVIACGSVDDGKSTLIGRLLAETGSVADDQLDFARRTRRGGSTIAAGEVDYSLLPTAWRPSTSRASRSTWPTVSWTCRRAAG